MFDFHTHFNFVPHSLMKIALACASNILIVLSQIVAACEDKYCGVGN